MKHNINENDKVLNISEIEEQLSLEESSKEENFGKTTKNLHESVLKEPVIENKSKNYNYRMETQINTQLY